MGRKNRNSKNEKINGDGRKLYEFLGMQRWWILNKNMERNGGEWMYVEGRRKSVIDYVLGNENMANKVEKVIIGDKVDSGHLRITIWIKTRKQRKKRRGRRREREKEECG